MSSKSKRCTTRILRGGGAKSNGRFEVRKDGGRPGLLICGAVSWVACALRHLNRLDLARTWHLDLDLCCERKMLRTNLAGPSVLSLSRDLFFYFLLCKCLWLMMDWTAWMVGGVTVLGRGYLPFVSEYPLANIR